MQRVGMMPVTYTVLKAFKNPSNTKRPPSGGFFAFLGRKFLKVCISRYRKINPILTADPSRYDDSETAWDTHWEMEYNDVNNI